MFNTGGTAPGLLVASPQLRDPNFEKTVVLMVEHHRHGALGMIVNRPTQMRVANAFYFPKIEWAGDPDSVIWFGGPVMRESCWLLHEPMLLQSHGGELQVSPDLVISSSEERLKELSENPPEKLRFIRGVAGWSSSQLDNELTNGLWLSMDLDSHLIFQEPAETMWEAAWREMGLISDEHITDLIKLIGRGKQSDSGRQRIFVSTGSALFDNLTIGYLLSKAI